jgi:hypothetical protein
MRNKTGRAIPISFQLPCPLPWQRTHDDDILVALIKDEHSMYVYWEVSEDAKRQIEHHFHTTWDSLHHALCVHDVTGIWFDGNNARSHSVVAFQGPTDNWYLHELPAGRDYVIDYLVQFSDSGWIPILRSNCVHTPRNVLNSSTHPTHPFATPVNAVAAGSWQVHFTGYSLQDLTFRTMN